MKQVEEFFKEAQMRQTHNTGASVTHSKGGFAVKYVDLKKTYLLRKYDYKPP